MHITVTQDHITRGIRGSGISCPVALAIGERIPQELVGVGSLAVELSIQGTSRHVSLPLNARLAINNYDTGHAIHPFSFELPIPEEQHQTSPHEQGTSDASPSRLSSAAQRSEHRSETGTCQREST
jgi:stringent starvation protein B